MKAHNGIYSKLESLRFKRTLMMLDNLISPFSPKEDPQEEITKLINAHSLEKPFFLNIHSNISEWIQYFKDHIDTSYKIITDKYQHTSLEKRGTLFPHLEYIDMHPVTIHKFLEMILLDINDNINHVMLDIRNQIFLKNIIDIFENNKSQNKPFYVIVGSAHTPFLYEELIEKGYQVKLKNYTDKEVGL